MNPEKSSSACVTFSSSLFITVDDPQSVNERLDLRDAKFNLCFGASRYLLMLFSPPYPIPKLFPYVLRKANFSHLQDFLTQLYFVVHSSLNETKYFTKEIKRKYQQKKYLNIFNNCLRNSGIFW